MGDSKNSPDNYKGSKISTGVITEYWPSKNYSGPSSD